MKKVLSLGLIMVLSLVAIPSAAAASIKCPTHGVIGSVIGSCEHEVCLSCSYCPTCNTNEYIAGTKIVLALDTDANREYTVTVPAKLIPKFTEEVSGPVVLEGAWASTEVIKVTADSQVTLTNSINSNDSHTLDVSLTPMEYKGNDLESQKYIGAVTLSSMPTNTLFGTWSGQFYFNVEINVAEIPLPEIGKTADDYTWGEIQAITNAGKADEYFDIGDTKTIITNDGQEIVVEVVGIHEDIKADGSGAAGISWASQIIIEERQMHPTTDINSWVESETRRWLQEDFIQELPEDLRSAIVNVNKTYYDNSDKTTKTCVDSLWIPSYREIFGNPNNDPNFETEGPDYTEFFHSENARVRYALDGSNAYWWVRTAAYNRNIGYFYAVNKISYFGAATMTAGVLLCFCT